MGRSPCCAKEGLNRGAWTAQEDKILREYVNVHGQGKWRNLPQRAGLKRCGKSCRLRWLNYLRPDIKRGNISPDEDELIIKLHKLLGNRWSLIAGRLPGRTDNEIKNYWNTNLVKRVKDCNSGASSAQHVEKNTQNAKPKSTSKVTTIIPPSSPNKPKLEFINVIRTKASKCSKTLFVDPFPHSSMQLQSVPIMAEAEGVDDAVNCRVTNDNLKNNVDDDGVSSFPGEEDKGRFADLLLDFEIGETCLPELLNSDFSCILDFSYNNEDDLLPFADQPLVSSFEVLRDKACDEANIANNNFFGC